MRREGSFSRSDDRLPVRLRDRDRASIPCGSVPASRDLSELALRCKSGLLVRCCPARP